MAGIRRSGIEKRFYLHSLYPLCPKGLGVGANTFSLSLYQLLYHLYTKPIQNDEGMETLDAALSIGVSIALVKKVMETSQQSNEQLLKVLGATSPYPWENIDLNG